MLIVTRTATGWRGPQAAMDALRELPPEMLRELDTLPRGWSLRFLADGVTVESPIERELADAAIGAWLAREVQ